MELSIDEALQQGVAAHKEGRAQDAERLYRAILKVQPNHPEASHNLGVLALSVGKAPDALPLFKRALNANPSAGQFWLSYIDALIKLERIEEAQQALVNAEQRVSAGSLDALNKLGSFVLWQKMSQIAKHERVKRTANKVVLACLMGEGEITMSRAEKAAFLKESASGDLVQQVVLADPELLHDISLAKVLIEKVAKPAFFQNVFLHYASGELQTAMLSMIDDLSLLQKLEKKTKGGDSK